MAFAFVSFKMSSDQKCNWRFMKFNELKTTNNKLVYRFNAMDAEILSETTDIHFS